MDAPDLSALRRNFPGLAREEGGRPCVFADSPGGSQVPDAVIEAAAEYLRTSNANTHGTFATSEETDALIAEARRAGADLTGAEPEEIVFGQNATTLLFAISRSVARTLGPGDEVVVTRLDHDANIRPWTMAAEDSGATVRWADIRPADVTLDLDSLDAVLSERTRVVAFTLASNAVGTITPAAEISRRAHEAGAIAVCDAVHVAQHRALDLRAAGADVLVCSPYKIFGPHLGVLAASRDLLESWTPYKVRPSPDGVPERWETGTLDHEALAGFVAAVGYLAGVGRDHGRPAGADRRAGIVAGFEAIRAYEAGLATRFLAGVARLPDLALYGIADPERTQERTPTFAIRAGERHPTETTRALGERGIFAWDGHYYALELMERLGLQATGGAVRIGFCHYNTSGEVDRVLDELAALS